MTVDPQIRAQVGDFYAAYTACIDDGRFDEWPDYFTEDAWYRVVPRENYDRGLPQSTLSLKGRPMMKDRIYGIQSTIFHAPYYQRHLLSLPTISPGENNRLIVEANYTVIRTKRDSAADILSVGRYLDEVATTESGMKFSRKFCIFDNDLIPNSLIYPI